MIGSYSILNAIALPNLPDKNEDYFTNIYILLYSGASGHKYKLNNYDVFSFCGPSSNMCISYSWDYENQDYINAIALRHGRKILNVNVPKITELSLDYSEGKLVSFGRNKYLEAKYKFLTGDEITCLHEVKNNELSKKKKLGISYIKDITINNFYIDPKTIYYFITFLAEVYDRLIRHGEYDLEEYYKNKLKDKFKDFESLFKYIKRRFYLYNVISYGTGILSMTIEYKRTSKQRVFFDTIVINQNGSIYMASKLRDYPTINVFYNVLNKTAKVITYDPPLEHFGDYILSDKGLLVTYENSKGERLIFDPNSLELVQIDVKDYIGVCFSYEKEFDTSICLEENNDILGTFGLIYEEMLAPKNIILIEDKNLISMYEDFIYVYSGSAEITNNYKETYYINKIFKYIFWKKRCILKYFFRYFI